MVTKFDTRIDLDDTLDELGGQGHRSKIKVIESKNIMACHDVTWHHRITSGGNSTRATGGAATLQCFLSNLSFITNIISTTARVTIMLHPIELEALAAHHFTSLCLIPSQLTDQDNYPCSNLLHQVSENLIAGGKFTPIQTKLLLILVIIVTQWR